jgi:hypothetical protein
MKHHAWGAVGGGFLISCVVATAIDQTFQGFGFEICNSLPDTGDVLSICHSAVKEQTSSGFAPVLLLLWIVSAVAILIFPSKNN